MIDIAKVSYDAELVTEDGTRYLLNDALISLQWEEQIGELAQRATITLVNIMAGDIRLAGIAKINCVILIYGRWGAGVRTLLFEGRIWEWQYVSSTQRELTLTAYDHLIRLQQSKDFKYYSAGLTTQALIGDICKEWGIPLAYKWGKSITHEKKKFSGDKISDMIIGSLEEVRQKTGEKFIAYYRNKQLEIVGFGKNETIYRFDTTNTLSTTDKLTLSNLVTRVKVLGKEDKEGRAPIDAVLNGDTRFGVLQEIIRRDSNKSIDAAKSEAQTMLKERGKPDETIQISVPDLPFFRKGDKIEVSAGNLSGFFFAEGVAHNATERQMTLTLTRSASS